MLARGHYLVLQCVPSALLPMSTSIMRTTFASAIVKRVYSFACERATIASQALQQKLENARSMGAVVVTTPASIKSLVLNFIECLVMKTDPDSKQFESNTLQRQTVIWNEVLSLFASGVCIMDEVDWVLHPLKSELNFPIGFFEMTCLCHVLSRFVMRCDFLFSHGVGTFVIKPSSLLVKPCVS